MTRRCYAVLAKVSLSYSPLQGRLVTCYSPVRHFTQDRSPFLVRLACVRHAASVDSEPGSNSRLKPVVWSTRRRSLDSDRVCARKQQTSYLVRMIKPNLIASHDWHVQPICQRSLRTFRLSGVPRIEAQTLSLGCPRTCCAAATYAFASLADSLARLSKNIEDCFFCQALFSCRRRPSQHHVGGCSSLER